MLKLERKVGETIYIGEDIVVTVLRTGSKQVVLGIKAPKNIAIHRDDYIDSQRSSDNP